MKNSGYILGIWLLLLCFSACERHDLLDDIARIGEQTPHVYWTLESSKVKAGTGVPFNVQYYTNGEPVAYLSVWYGIRQSLSMSATCPIATGFNFIYTVGEESKSRVNQEIIRYPQNEDYWDAAKRAYQFKGEFPTSSTLAMVEWNEPVDFDETKFQQLFPDTFAANFQKGLYAQLAQDKNLADYRKVLVSTNTLTTEQFDVCLDSVFNQNSSQWDKFVKPDQVEYLRQQYYTIPFQTLTYSTVKSYYAISYRKQFILNATFRVTDNKGVQGISDEYDVEIN